MTANQPYDRQQRAQARARGEGLPHGRALGGSPWWFVVAGLLILAMIGSGSIIAGAVASEPDDLTEVRLAGPRPPGRLNVVLLLDVSGSFADYAGLRQQALEQVIRWAPENLREDDTLTIISFALDAEVTMPPVAMRDLAGQAGSIQPWAADGRDTLIVPALEKAAAVVPAEGATGIIVLTDTLVKDAVAADVDPLLTAMNTTSMAVITPDGVGLIAPWQEAFAWEAEFHADAGDARQTALAVGNAFAHATGQQLERSEK